MGSTRMQVAAPEDSSALALPAMFHCCNQPLPSHDNGKCVRVGTGSDVVQAGPCRLQARGLGWVCWWVWLEQALGRVE